MTLLTIVLLVLFIWVQHCKVALLRKRLKYTQQACHEASVSLQYEHHRAESYRNQLEG